MESTNTIDEDGSNVALSSTEEEISNFIVNFIAHAMNLNFEDIELDDEISSFGIDSVQMVSMSAELEDKIGKEISPTLLYNYPTISLISKHIASL